MSKSVLSITCTLLFLSITVQGQIPKNYRWNVYWGGGISSLQYKPEGATYKPELGGELGVSWNYFLKPQWALNTGLELNLYRSKTQSGHLSGRDSGIDPIYPDYNYEMDYDYQSFEEKQKLYTLNIPVMLQYWFSPKFYLAGGGKLGIPVSGKYETSASNLTTTGFFSYEGRTYSGTNYGFQSSDHQYTKQDLDMEVACILSVEVGIKWKSSFKSLLLTSIYLDYGLNNMQKNISTTLVSYQPENRNYLEFNSITSTTKKVNILATGIKIGMSF